MAKVKKIAKAQFGAPIKKGGYRGGCAATTSGADRAERKEARVAERDYKKAVRVAGREERKAERAEKKAAKSAPEAKSGMKVKKAQSGKMVPSEMKPGKMIKKADRDARADKMVDALNKQAGKGSSARPMGMNFDKKSFDKVPSFDKYIKKTENKKVAPKKKMMNGGKAKKMMGGGKCKNGC